MEWGISIGDLADILGVGRSLVSNWENGKAVPHSGRLKRLSEWFAEDIPNGLVKRDESISGRLRKRRLEWGVTQLELAERLGVSESTVSAWEAGRTLPKYSRLKLINGWFAEEIPADRNRPFDIGDLAEGIRNARLERGMTLTELGRHLKVDRTTLAQWERGSNIPKRSNLPSLSKWFAEDVPVKEREMARYEELGRRIRGTRQELGMSSRELARYLRVGNNRIYEWERGQSVLRPSSLELINRWLRENTRVNDS